MYFEGSPSLKAEAGTLFLCTLVALILVAGGVAAGIRFGGKAWFVALAAVVVAVAVFAWPILRAKSTRYKISNYRIDYEHGVLSKTIDTLELWHVEDPQFRQTLSQRLLNVGTIIIISNDPTTPLLEMKGLPNPRHLFDALKSRIISVKRSRGVLKVDA